MQGVCVLCPLGGGQWLPEGLHLRTRFDGSAWPPYFKRRGAGDAPGLSGQVRSHLFSPSVVASTLTQDLPGGGLLVGFRCVVNPH